MTTNPVSSSRLYTSLLPKTGAGTAAGTAGAKVSTAEKTASAVSPVSHSFSYKEGKANVHEVHYEVEKGQNSNLVGSYSYKTESAKAGRLKTQLAMEKSKLRDVETKAPKNSKAAAKERGKIKNRVKKLQDQLKNEIDSSPVTRVVVHEKTEKADTEDLGYDLELSSAAQNSADTAEDTAEEA